MKYAGFFGRILALFLDAIIVVTPLAFVVNILDKVNHGLVAFLVLILHLFFYQSVRIICVKLFSGTPGMLVLKMKVKPEGSNALSWKTAILRESVFLLGALMGLYITIFYLLQSGHELMDISYRQMNFLIPTENYLRRLFSDFITVLVGLNYLLILLNHKRKSLHDFIAKTIVLKQ